MQAFKEKMCDYQVRWRKVHLSHITKNGCQNRRYYSHILPWTDRLQNFYEPIREPLFNECKGY